ncbi:MAG: transglycosylase domain-containing protein, partial [Candidatus Dormibacteraceae bacterium]
VLSLYLNSIFYGNGSFGTEAAAESYFGVQASQLTLPQASFLAGLPRAPSGYDPFAGPDARAGARQRWREVLNSMVATREITPKQAHAAFTTDIWTRLDATHRAALGTARDPGTAHFLDYVVQYLVRTYGVKETYQGGLKVVTTLDLASQRDAVRRVQHGVAVYRYKGANTGALLAMNPRSGEILAMVGSASYDDAAISGQVNLTLAKRQPGSSFKIYTYGAALEHGLYTAATKLDDRHPVIDGHRFTDWDGRLEGMIPLRRAFEESRNLPALWVYKRLGSQMVIDFARRLGITTPIDPHSLTVTIGSADVEMIQHLAAYSTFANGGYRVSPHAILRITDDGGRVLESYDGGGSHVRVISPELAYLVTSILRGPVRTELGWPLAGRPVAAKSGTTESWTNAWWVGYSPDLAVASMMAHIDSGPACKSGFGYLASGFKPTGWMCPTDVLWGEHVGITVWAPFVESYYRRHPWPADWTRPPGIVTDTVCRQDGNLATATTPANQKYDEIFIRGTGEPSATCGGAAADGQPGAQPAPGAPPTPSPSPGGSPAPAVTPPRIAPISPRPSASPSPSPSPT